MERLIRQSGTSITELELDEASASLAEVQSQDIVILPSMRIQLGYLNTKRTKSVAIAGLTRLRIRAKLHTYTFSSGQENLIFCVTGIYSNDYLKF